MLINKHLLKNAVLKFKLATNQNILEFIFILKCTEFAYILFQTLKKRITFSKVTFKKWSQSYHFKTIFMANVTTCTVH